MRRHLGLEPQDTEYAAMLHGLRQLPQRQLEVLRLLLDGLPLPSDPPLVREIGRAFGVDDIGSIGANSQAAFARGREQEGSCWNVGWTTVDEDGICSLTSRQLQALDVPDAEEEELFAFSAQLANDSGRNRNFRSFQKWLQSQVPFDIVIDGANVGFNNQNREGGHFQYPQIDTLVQQLRSAGKRVLLVLHSKWLKEDADLSVVKRKKRKLDQISLIPAAVEDDLDDEVVEPELVYPFDPITEEERSASPGSHLHLVRQWKEQGVLVRVPFQDCDDWYWLFAAMDSARRGAKEVQVVSNDQMRDHHWRMLGPRAFRRWQGRHMTRVSIWSETPESMDYCVTLTPPRPFSVQAQVASDGKAWHFPIPAIQSRAEQLQSGRPVASKEIEAAEHKWLVAWCEACDDSRRRTE